MLYFVCFFYDCFLRLGLRLPLHVVCLPAHPLYNVLACVRLERLEMELGLGSVLVLVVVLLLLLLLVVLLL